MRKIYALILVLAVIWSCNKEEAIPLQAVITEAANGQVGEPITLDGSESTGLDRASVEWIYNGGPEFSVSFDTNSITTSFTPQKTGTYNFTLRLTSGSEFSEAVINIAVSGNLELTSLAATTTLEDINNQTGEDGEADYIINSVLTIPSGTTITLGNSVTIAFGSEGGIIVEGTLNTEGSAFVSLVPSGTSSWKGILVKQGGNIDLQSGTTIISGGGSASLTDTPEDASTLMIDGSASLGGGVTIKNSNSFALSLGTNGNLSYSTILFESNTNTFRMPNYKLASIPLQNLGLSNESPTARIELFAAEGHVIQGSASISGVSHPIYVEGDIELAGSASLAIQGVELRFAEGKGILANGTCSFFNTVFTGQTESAGSWKGIFLGASNSNHQINSCTIQYAGGATFETASGPAGIYQSSSANATAIQNNVISHNLGIGFINDSFIASFSGNEFSDNSLAHARINISELNKLSTNTYSSDVPTIELQKQFGGIVTNLTWPSLGDGNYYVCKVNIDASILTLPEGLHVKFDVNTYLNITGAFKVEGTDTNPVILEGAVGNAGDWIGVGFSNTASIDYLVLKHAGRVGGTSLFNTPFDANLTVMSNPALSVSITNSTISDGSGYGVLVKLGAGTFNITDGASNNTLAGNLGDFYDAN